MARGTGGEAAPEEATLSLAEQPLDMYQVRFHIYPNANGPLGEMIIAGVSAVGRVFNLQHLGPLCTYTDAYPAPGDSVVLRMWLALVLAIVLLGGLFLYRPQSDLGLLFCGTAGLGAAD